MDQSTISALAGIGAYLLLWITLFVLPWLDRK
jgi:hypothetical protein